MTLLNRSYHWVPVAIFAASILITGLFWKVLPNSFRLNEGTDYVTYYEPVSRNLLAGNGLTLGGQPDISHPPGYSLLLAGVFAVSHTLRISEDSALAAFAALCMAMVSVLVFYLSRTIWDMRPAVIASLLWMTYPFALWLTKQPNSELPFMVAFYCGLALFWSAIVRRTDKVPIYAICGFLFGLSMLIRPFAIGLGLTMALVVWLVKSDVRKLSRLLLVMALLAGNVAAVLPWEIWAYSQTGRVVALGTGGVGGIRDGLTFGADRKDYREDNEFSRDVKQAMADFRINLANTETLRGVISVVFAEARVHPLGVAKLLLLKIARSWYGTDSFRKEGWILLIQILYLLLLLWCTQRLWQSGEPQSSRFALSVLVLVVYFWGMSVLGTSLLRYLVPITGLVFVLMSGAFSSVASKANWSKAGAHKSSLHLPV